MPTFDSFLSADIKYARSLFDDSAAGVLVIRLDTAYSVPQAAMALVLEHRPIEARQHTFSIPAGTAVPRRLAAGSYTVVVTADGFEPFRAHVEIVAGKVVDLVAALEKTRDCAHHHVRDIVARYGIPWNGHAVRNLVVETGTSVVLDASSPDFAQNRHVVRVATAKQAKDVFGVADTHWPANAAARFGSQYSAEPRFADQGRVTPAALAAMREYIYGNSRRVDGWAAVLDNMIQENPVAVSFHVFQDIDVGPHATLIVDDTGLLCNRMKVHLTGQVIVTGVGPIRVEMNSYQLYGLVLATTTTTEVLTGN